MKASWVILIQFANRARNKQGQRWEVDRISWSSALIPYTAHLFTLLLGDISPVGNFRTGCFGNELSSFLKIFPPLERKICERYNRLRYVQTQLRADRKQSNAAWGVSSVVSYEIDCQIAAIANLTVRFIYIFGFTDAGFSTWLSGCPGLRGAGRALLCLNLHIIALGDVA